MNDLDRTIKHLVNSAVDVELTGHRTPPPLDRPGLAERPGPSRPHPVALWRVPALAASVAALLVAGTVLVIGHDGDRRPTPPAASASPTPSVSQSTASDPSAAARAYREALARAREATEVAGVSAWPVFASNGEWASSGVWSLDGPYLDAPAPGRIYTIAVRHVTGSAGKQASASPGQGASVVSGELLDGASGTCPRPFVTQPDRIYVIRCQVEFQAGAIGKVRFTSQDPTGTATYTFALNKSAGKAVTPSASPSIDPTPALSNCIGSEPGPENAPTLPEAQAGAREASEVPGVTVVPVSEQDAALHRDGLDTGPTIDESLSTAGFPDKAQPGKTYWFTVKYVAHPGADPVAVLRLSFQNVTVGRCPGPILVRAGHTYLLRCQVTLPARGGDLWAALRSDSGSTGYRLI